MDFLFVQPRFPGQYRHLMRRLAADGHRILFLYDAAMVSGDAIAGVTALPYGPVPGSNGVHPFATDIDQAVRRAEAVREAAEGVRSRGFSPSLVCAHHGYGESLFLRHVFPAARHLTFFEYHYTPDDPCLGFDPEFPADTATLRRAAQVRGAVALMALEAADAGVTPTHWQHSLFPAAYRSRIAVVHDGIDTRILRPDPAACLTLPDGTVLRAGEPVVTFCARALEPLRGIHTFLRALPQVLAGHPAARVVIAGVDGTAYGPGPSGGETTVQMILRQLGGRLNRSRVHFCGWLGRDDLTRLFQVSACHVYLTYPFVLSWSVLEAMAAGAPVVGSDTAPLREVISDGHTGYLVNFFSPEALAGRVLQVLDTPQDTLRHAARAAVQEHYSLDVCLPRHMRLMGLE